MDAQVTPPLRLENAAVLDALDMLSMQTHNFFEVLDGQSIIVVPDSGTDQLVGLAGSMIIKITDEKHFYEFDYTLPR